MDIKRKVATFGSGKTIRLDGNSIGISKGLELGEGYGSNILAAAVGTPEQKEKRVNNPQGLTRDELMELADFNIQLWMNLKANLWKYSVDNPAIFGQDGGK